MKDALVPLLTGLFGAAVGFIVTRLNDWLSEHRDYKRSSRHLKTELANISRHYAYMREKLAPHEAAPGWMNIVHLETGRFYGSGLGTFGVGMLRLFEESIAADAMYLMLMLRNNNAYIDQAKEYLVAGDKATFGELCEELIKRCDETIEHARGVAATLDPPRKP